MKPAVSKKQLREFGFLIGFGFPILIGWVLAAVAGHGFREWTIIVGLSGLILGLLAPRFLYYPYKGWMKLGYVLGWINSRLILGMVFIVVLLPIAYVMRLTGYDPLRKNRTGKTTYKENRQGHQTDLTRIF